MGGVNGYNGRNARIDYNVATGATSARRGAVQRQRSENIRNDARAYATDGNGYTRAERQEIRGRRQDLSHDIFQAAHNGKGPGDRAR